jgi:hypothetical protein
MTIKEQVLAMVEDLPDDVGFERIEYHIYVLKKIRQGEAALDRGEGLSQEEVERRLARWLKP